MIGQHQMTDVTVPISGSPIYHSGKSPNAYNNFKCLWHHIDPERHHVLVSLHSQCERLELDNERLYYLSKLKVDYPEGPEPIGSCSGDSDSQPCIAGPVCEHFSIKTYLNWSLDWAGQPKSEPILPCRWLGSESTNNISTNPKRLLPN